MSELSIRTAGWIIVSPTETANTRMIRCVVVSRGTEIRKTRAV